MVPTLGDGDYVLLKRYGRFRRPRPGDVAFTRRGEGPMLIKRPGERDGQGRFGLFGDGATSAPAVDLGYAPEQEIVGCAILGVSGSRIDPMRRRRHRSLDTEADTRTTLSKSAKAIRLLETAPHSPNAAEGHARQVLGHLPFQAGLELHREGRRRRIRS